MSYYAANPHYAPDADRSELALRIEQCEAEAQASFKQATKEALADFHRTVAHIPDPQHSPRWQRAKDAAKAKYETVSKPALELQERTFHELMATGEISEGLDFEWTMLRSSYALNSAIDNAERVGVTWNWQSTSDEMNLIDMHLSQAAE